VRATVTTIDAKSRHQKHERFYVRVGNGTREISDELEIERYIAQRWGN
jgi:hypothetical protein